MKHLVQIQITTQAGVELEARPGGPGAVIGRIVDRFKPEAVYMSPAHRAIYLVCDLTTSDMAELMLVSHRFAGQNPVFTPVIEGKEFGAMLGKALPASRKLFEG
ncbi:MAG: hypothetical protein IT370_15275 [Deltaproteobacteria bacterium]|nr:hypothetical protein [Deltaproteobacteria bacterium]